MPVTERETGDSHIRRRTTTSRTVRAVLPPEGLSKWHMFEKCIACTSIHMTIRNFLHLWRNVSVPLQDALDRRKCPYGLQSFALDGSTGFWHCVSRSTSPT